MFARELPSFKIAPAKSILWILPSGKFYEGGPEAELERSLYKKLKNEFLETLEIKIIETPHALASEVDFHQALHALQTRIQNSSARQFIFAYSRGADLLWEGFEEWTDEMQVEAILVWGNPVEFSLIIPAGIKRLELTTGVDDVIAYVEGDDPENWNALNREEPKQYLARAASYLFASESQKVETAVIEGAGHCLPASEPAVQYLKSWIRLNLGEA